MVKDCSPRQRSGPALTHRLSTACMEMKRAGTLKVSKNTSAARSRFFRGFSGASVRSTGCCGRSPEGKEGEVRFAFHLSNWFESQGTYVSLPPKRGKLALSPSLAPLKSHSFLVSIPSSFLALRHSHSLSECLGCSPGFTPNSILPLACTPGESRGWLKDLTACHPRGRPGQSSWLLALA